MLVWIFSTFENSKRDLESKFDRLVDFFCCENMMWLLDLKSRIRIWDFIGGFTLELFSLSIKPMILREVLWNAPFSEPDWKNGAFQDFRTLKSRGISRKNHVIDFKTGKGPKINMFDFGTFRDFRAYALTCKKYPSHVFWAF